MQDEIIKHTKNIHGAMSNKNHSFKEKVKEVAVEIFIIVFAVSPLPHESFRVVRCQIPQNTVLLYMRQCHYVTYKRYRFCYF